ncbi:MAG: hypothetical protein U1F41_07400 [Burkholderiales bacterium]
MKARTFVRTATDADVASWAPLIVVCLWLGGLAYALWQLALSSAQPPIYDGLSYFTKAKNYWEAASQRLLVNPFGIFPAVRPPGTILMSFPFGYDGDFHGFHFRSIFAPILVASLSAWLLLRNCLAGRGSAAVAVSLTLAVASLPMFYSLEPAPDLPHHSVWGHVDAFLASIAALATAGYMVSLRTRSLWWLTAGAAAAAFSLFVKPAGMIVMLLSGTAWFAFSCTWLVLDRDDQALRRRGTRYLRLGVAIIVALYATALLLSVSSGYLTRAEINYFRTGLSVLSGMRAAPWTLREIDSILAATIGYPFAALCLIGIAGSAWLACKATAIRELLCDIAIIGMVSGLAFLVLGIGWWMVTTSGTMVRYIFPILLMPCVAFLPTIGLTALRSGPTVFRAVLFVAFASALNLAALLLAPAPSLAWQRASGVNLSAGRSNDAAEAAGQFLARNATASRRIVIYMFGAQASITTFESVINFAALTHPAKKPEVQFLRPVDWVRSSTYRLNEVLSADYLLVPPLRGYSPLPRNGNHYLEDLAMRAWASSLSIADGVEAEVSLPDLQLLKIVDRSALHKSMLAFVGKYEWSPDFNEANASLWSDLRELAQRIQSSRLLMGPSRFGNELEILAITSRRESADRATEIDVWWKPIDDHAGIDATLTFQLHSATDQILLAGEIPLPMRRPPDMAKPIRHDAAFFRLAMPADARLVVTGVRIGDTVLPAQPAATAAR